MNYWKYWFFGRASGEPDTEQEGFGDLREFIYLDELSVRSLLASTGEGGIPVETSNKSLKENTRQSGGGIGTGSVGVSAQMGVESQQREQVSRETTSSFEASQSKFTRLYESPDVNKSLSLGQVTSAKSSEDSEKYPLANFSRGDVLELRINLQATLPFRLYRASEYFHNVVPEQFDAEAEQTLELIRESIGESIPVTGTASDYELVNDGSKYLQPLPPNESPDDDSKVFLVSQLNRENLRGNPIRTLFGDDEYIMYCRVESVDVGNWRPLKMTRVLDSFSEDAAQQFHEMVEEGLRETQIKISETDYKLGADVATISNHDISQNMIQYYSELLENETEVEIDDDVRESIIDQTYESVDLEIYESRTEARKAILERFTSCFIDQTDLDNLEPGTRLELRNKTATNLSKSISKGDRDEYHGIDPTFKVKPIAIYW